jgi:GR25 family glycosyltransferase involved in LPS biosynthesis
MHPIFLFIIYLILVGIFYNNKTFFNHIAGKCILFIAIIILFVINITIGLLFLFTINILYKYEYKSPNIHAYIINLDKNKNQYENTRIQYEESDLNDIIPLSRFSAIFGKTINLHDYLTEQVIMEIEETEKKGKRTYHHQLTKGGIGCFISHLTLYQQLVKDSYYSAYLIFEDDIHITPNIKTHIDYSMKNIPTDWDIILYSSIRSGNQPTINSSISIVDYFWGMQCYLINRRGAENIIRELDNQPIDGQIDSYLSRMIKQGKLKVYLYNKKIVYEISNQTDIQIDIEYTTDIDPFDYKGYIMR